MPALNFEHRHAAHCESGVAAGLLRHQGAPLSEALAFGLASALDFAYLPFIRLGGQPVVAFRARPRAILKGLRAPLGADLRFETFRDPAAAQARLDALLDQGRVVGLQTSVYWLPYFPPDMRFHFNGHNLLVYGREGDDYLVSDPVFEEPVRCPRADLERARFAKGLLAPRGLLYHARSLARREPEPAAVRAAIGRVARSMLTPAPVAGVRGMRLLARRFESLPAAGAEPFIGHVVRMQEEIGTGGAGFRFLYAAFLQEAAARAERPVLQEFSQRLDEIGDGWRRFALASARMVKGRDPVAPPQLAGLLRGQASAEEAFFRDLRAAVR